MKCSKEENEFDLINVNFKELKKIIKETSDDKEKKGNILLEFLNETLQTILDSDQIDENLIKSFIKYLLFSDIKYFTIKSILIILKNKKENNLIYNKNFSDTLTKLLLAIKLPILTKQKDKNEFLKIKPFILDDNFIFNYEAASKQYSEIWSIFLTFQISFDSYKKILASMDTKILPHFKSPLILTDFLINSYELGGSVALLSLSSLFLLITKYSLDYPDFFEKFYHLVTPEILHVKYRSRFLYWSDIFLSSTNLPAYVIAAFIKKFSRLALISSVETLYSLIPIINNLLIRHPNLIDLFNKENKYLNDPFNFEEKDLKNCKALESSLWELKALQKHWNYEIRELARFINFKLSEDEINLEDCLETGFSDLTAQAFEIENDNNEIELNHDLYNTALEFFSK